MVMEIGDIVINDHKYSAYQYSKLLLAALGEPFICF